MPHKGLYANIPNTECPYKCSTHSSRRSSHSRNPMSVLPTRHLSAVPYRCTPFHNLCGASNGTNSAASRAPLLDLQDECWSEVLSKMLPTSGKGRGLQSHRMSDVWDSLLLGMPTDIRRE